MIYLIGGAPRAGKSILCQQFSAELRIGWISTDLMMELLRVNGDPVVKNEWNAAPAAIAANAKWFYPYLERFIWGVNSCAKDYVIEGVDFLPAQVLQLLNQYPIRTVFLGCSRMTLKTFDQYPGHSVGYSHLPEQAKRQIIHDVPLWSEFIREEAGRFGFSYHDTSDDFEHRIQEARARLLE
ncbi:MAG TPA: hypothetical protein VK909_21655 [Anaerolineales bacterium]|nr:hypothetical protein [Anaerolineales bacterium]